MIESCANSPAKSSHALCPHGTNDYGFPVCVDFMNNSPAGTILKNVPSYEIC